MTELFVRVLNMSISASVVALLLLGLRGLLGRRLPAKFCYLLWWTVLFRLLVPWSLPAALSLFNLTGGDLTQPIHDSYMVTLDYMESGYVPVQAPDTQNLFFALSVVWLTVAALMVLYILLVNLYVHRISKTIFPLHQCDERLDYCRGLIGIRQKVRVYHCSGFDSPIVLGWLHPKIILPTGMDFSDQRLLTHIFTHELLHIRRMDCMTKRIAILGLVLHWFNPLVFLCYRLFERDIEASCDEGALAVLGEKEGAGYASSLLSMFIQCKARWGLAALSFGETAIKRRVTGAVAYKKLSPMRRVLLSIMVIVIGLAATTNPIVVANGYVPAGTSISAGAQSAFEAAAVTVAGALTRGDAVGLLALSRSDDPYYLPLYDWLAAAPIPVESYKLYPQSDALAYCYLKTQSEEYTATFTKQKGAIQLEAIYPKAVFEAAMQIPEDSEQVRFVRNLHRFGIRTGFANSTTLPAPNVAALCIDEEHRDRVKRGELAQQDIYLQPEWIADAAKQYFGLPNFSYTFDEALYDSTRDKYIYDKERGERTESTIVAQWDADGNSYVTAQFYKDPLHMTVDKTITYTLKKK